ncbi:MAG TPA: SDR family NAD(P)-dependent oxidoreductase [Gemmatimonas sp.]|nr:SDR family NAD(P)-dependent oxidoreductase [Gemmatimonas sp.]
MTVRATPRSGRRTLVTGAGRPLGVEFVRQSLLLGDTVYAAARNPARVPVLADLRAEFRGLELIALDPADAASVADAVPVLESLTGSLDRVVIAPAEPGPHERLADGERDALLATMSGTGLVEHYRRHAVAPVLLIRTLLPWLEAADSPQILAVSSWLGSLSGKSQGGDYATCGSAAAYHMLLRALAHDLAPDILVLIGNPGNVATTPDAPAFRVPIDESAAGLLAVIDTLPIDRSGAFVDWTGSERAW